ncbi:MAG: helix-turn-helix transcriptional regulator [Coriobacteriia bacterium]
MTMIQPHEIRFTQADYLRKAREIAGLTQQQLADRIGIDRASVINYEKRGTRKRYILRDWAEATEVSLAQISNVDPSDYKTPVSHPRTPRTTSTRPRGRNTPTAPNGRTR